MVALLFVLFAASSVAGMTALAYPEIGAAIDPSPQVAMAHMPTKLLGFSGRVLGDATSIRVGQLIYTAANQTVYLVASNGLYGFTNSTTFYAWGFTTSSVLPENAAEQNLAVLGNVPMPQTGCATPLLQIAGTCGGLSNVGFAVSGSPTAGTVGQSYSTTFGIFNQTPSDTYTIVGSGNVPGLSFAAQTGTSTGFTGVYNLILSGTPTQAGSFPIVIAASDISNNKTSSQNYTIIIANAATTTSSAIRVGQLVYDPNNKTVYLVGQTVKYGFTDAKTFYSWNYAFNQVVPANSSELVLPTGSNVPFKLSGCSSPLVQINNTCSQTAALSQPTITGPATVVAGTVATYNFVSTSPFGSLGYSINWGDGSSPSLGSNLTSGMVDTQYHIWATSGSYTITASVTDAKGNNSNNTFYVQVFANPGGGPVTFQLSQTSFSFTANQGDVIYQQKSATFVNTTSNPVSYSLSVDNQPAWFNEGFNTSTNTAYPGTLIGLGAAINPAGLATGTYTSAIKINGSFAGAPIVIPVTLTINPAPAITAVPTLVINQFLVLPATVGNAYSSAAITFNQTGSANPILVTFTGLPSGIGMPETMSPGQVFSSEQFSQYEQGSVIVLVGTPTQTGTYPVTLTVSNQSGLTKTQQFVIVVNPGSSATAGVRVGKLVYSSGESTIYLVAPTGLYSFTDAQTFYNWGFNFNNILPENIAESALPVLGNVPAKQSGCNDPLDQINGMCGVSTSGGITITTTDSLILTQGTYGKIGFKAQPPNGYNGYTYSFTETGTVPGMVFGSYPCHNPAMTMACPLSGSNAGSYAPNILYLDGVPTAAGTFPITITAKDQSGNIGIQSFTITINGVPTQSPRVGQLVFTNGGTVYLVGSNALYGIPTIAVFNSWGWAFANVATANSAEAALSVSSTLVPSRNPNCNSAIDQINGTCGGGSAGTTYIKITSPAGGEQWVLGSTHTITWDPSTTGGNPLTIVLNGGSGSTYTLTTSAPNNGSFSWAISSNISVGNYILTISGPEMCTNSYPAHCYGAPGTSQSFYLVNPTNSIVNISSLNPTSGPVGSTQVTVTGTGFTPTGNTIQFDVYSFANVSSTNNGTTLTFSVPSTLYYNICQSGKMCPNLVRITTNGSYNVSVTNANGTSNTQVFTVTGSPGLQP
jgi:hypothetical protein